MFVKMSPQTLQEVHAQAGHGWNKIFRRKKKKHTSINKHTFAVIVTKDVYNIDESIVISNEEKSKVQ